MVDNRRYSKEIARLKKRLASLNKSVASCKDDKYVLQLEKQRDAVNMRLTNLINYSKQIS